MSIASLTRPAATVFTISLLVSMAADAHAAPQTSTSTPDAAGSGVAQDTAPATQPATPPADAPNTTPPEAEPPKSETPVATPTEPAPAEKPPASPSFFHATEVQYLHGWRYREPASPDTNVQKDILTFSHFSEWAFGRNFFFFDLIKSRSDDGNANEIYGEAYTTLSASKILKKSLEASIFRDVGLTMGVNAGAKTSGPGPLVYLPGVTIDWKIPGFAFFNVDVLAYIDKGQFAGNPNGCRPSTFQITPAWLAPFNIGSQRFNFQGFVDIIGSHGTCEVQVLTQPQLRYDVGNLFNAPDKLFVGIEFQYWLNKYGIKDLTEYNPQTLVVWRL